VRCIGHGAHGRRVIGVDPRRSVRQLISLLFLIAPTTLLADSGTCGAERCTASASVEFKITIPAVTRVRFSGDPGDDTWWHRVSLGNRKIYLYNNTRTRPAITTDRSGVTTMAFP